MRRAPTRILAVAWLALCLSVAAMSVIMEPGVFFTGRCTMLENGSEAVEMIGDSTRSREAARV